MTTEVLVLEWAADRGLLDPDGASRQLLKLSEECGEVCGAFLKGSGVKEEIGDVLVVLTILCAQLGYSLDECHQAAYEKIRNRTGKTVNNVFIRDAQ